MSIKCCLILAQILQATSASKTGMYSCTVHTVHRCAFENDIVCTMHIIMITDN